MDLKEGDTSYAGTDVITCCDVCRPYVPLVATRPGDAWCPKCGRQWEDIQDALQKPVAPQEET